ncbi:hypothetical protein BGZ83_009420 [Gryganskiella cystojenkinii]|nr:hypothetical protein BGZ83_009420 [Gryganskiella cystojenkinii]
MFHFSSKNVLSGSDSLDLTEILLKNAQDSEKPTTKLALCGYVDELLGHMKKFVKRPSPSTAHNGSSITKAQGTDDGQSMRERIARAYLEHAKLMADLGHPDMAQESRRRADKWG